MVASPAGLLRPTLARRLFETRVVTLRAGDEMTPEILLEALDEGGYRREDPVTAAGEVARRGGILDVFPPDRDAPVRIEFYGDTVYALRSFDPETQRTTGEVDALEVQPLSDAFAPRSVAAELARILPERFPGHRALPPLLDRLARGLAGGRGRRPHPARARGHGGALGAPRGYAWWPWSPRRSWRRRRPCTPAPARIATAAPTRSPSTPTPCSSAPLALAERLRAGPALHLREVDTEGRGAHVAGRPVRRYAGDLRRLVADLQAHAGSTVMLLGTPGRADRLTESPARGRALRGGGHGDRSPDRHALARL